MEAEYKKDMKKNYLVLKEADGTGTGITVSGLSTEFYLKMMLNNEIPGLLEFELRVINNQNHYYYDVTGIQTLEAKAGQGNFTHEQLREILGQMLDIIEEGKEYFLKEEDYILGEKYMYWSEERQRLSICYYPGYQADIQEQIRDFTVFLMDNINYREEAAVVMVYGFNKISTQEDCSFEKLKEVLDRKQEQPAKAGESLSRDREKIKEQMLRSLELKKEEEQRRREVKIEEKRRGMGVGLSHFCLMVTVFLGIFLYQGVLKEHIVKNPVPAALIFFLLLGGCIVWCILEIIRFCRFIKKCNYYCLISEGPGSEEEEFWISELPCYIGKSTEQNRIVISNQAVSRHHARIDEEAGQYFITDLHSTNGTYINNLRIPPEQKVMINDCDEISFADASYKFQMKSLRMPLHY